MTTAELATYRTFSKRLIHCTSKHQKDEPFVAILKSVVELLIFVGLETLISSIKE